MATLSTGTKAPEFELPVLQQGTFSVQSALKEGPIVAAFFKISCPTCQYAFPYLERIHKAYAGGKVRVIGVSQDGRRDTESFAREYGLSFPLLLDDTRSYPVSNAYGLTHVPTVFFISPDGAIEFTSIGWDRRDFDELNRRVAEAAGAPRVQIFRPGEQVADYKGG